MSVVAIVVDGVLRQHGSDGVIPQGALLYHSLKDTTRLALLTNDENPEVFHWLKVNGFNEHIYVIPPTALGLDMCETRKRQMKRLYKDGTDLSFVVEPNPEVAAGLMQEGFAVLLLLHPRYSRPDFRPDYDGSTVTPWRQLAGEVERQRELRARDKRADMEAL